MRTMSSDWMSLLPNRLWAKVRVTDGCWHWEACTQNGGYGMFKLNGGMRYVHRLTYAAYHQIMLPAGKAWQVNHKCKNTACCNPSHLELLGAAAHLAKDMSKAYCQNKHNLKLPNAQTTSGHCRECQKEHKIRYYEDNKERIKAQYREYYMKNRDRINAQRRARRRAARKLGANPRNEDV